eukprot:9056942-Alexandrium_andersonii.AAC.1
MRPGSSEPTFCHVLHGSLVVWAPVGIKMGLTGPPASVLIGSRGPSSPVGCPTARGPPGSG